MERAVPIIPADDLRVAREFYVAKLGFEVVGEALEHEIEGILVIERGTIRITVDCPMEGHGRAACVGLEVDDADAYFSEWHERVDGVSEPKNEPWGARTFSLQDPFDNTIFVMGPVR